ncbi:biotin transporter BioY [Vagococcus sp.]|uniref:biotin transporter BioY n=1 Tax=Vagococcus sp. TaxID=1933889 RepID=UPI003F96EF45
MSTKKLVHVSLMTAIIIVLSQVSLPLTVVPVTLQTFAIPLAGLLLGKRLGSIAALLYLLLGLMGLPVFANFSGGVAVFFGPTGGFLLSFPIMAYLAGWGAEKFKKSYLIFGLMSGLFFNYFVGTLYFIWLTSLPLKVVFATCVLPFLFFDFFKIGILLIITKRVQKRIGLLV